MGGPKVIICTWRTRDNFPGQAASKLGLGNEKDFLMEEMAYYEGIKMGHEKKGPRLHGWWEIDMEGENTGMVIIKATT